MAQLMSAVVGVLNESLTESIKAFYRLRKAYIALDGIMQMEEKYLQEQNSKSSTSSSTSLSKSTGPPPGAWKSGSSLENSREQSPQPQPRAPDTGRRSLDNELEALDLSESDIIPEKPRANTVHMTHDPDSDIFNKPVDVFVHSGANLCFGLLLLLISMVPPAFNKLLYVVGFRGDRSRGLQMLWQATKFHNLNGAIAGLALLAFYNGFVRYCEIHPDARTQNGDDIDSYPGKKLVALLSEMRNRFPRSQLWLLEESRMQGANKNLDGALKLLSGASKSPLRQVEALLVFEKSLNSMYLHEYELCAQSFLEVSNQISIVKTQSYLTMSIVCRT